MAEALAPIIVDARGHRCPVPTLRLRRALVSRPVALYTGTAATGEAHFNMPHRQTMNRIRMAPAKRRAPAVRNKRA